MTANLCDTSPLKIHTIKNHLDYKYNVVPYKYAKFAKEKPGKTSTLSLKHDSYYLANIPQQNLELTFKPEKTKESVL